MRGGGGNTERTGERLGDTASKTTSREASRDISEVAPARQEKTTKPCKTLELGTILF